MTSSLQINTILDAPHPPLFNLPPSFLYPSSLFLFSAGWLVINGAGMQIRLFLVCALCLSRQFLSMHLSLYVCSLQHLTPGGWGGALSRVTFAWVWVSDIYREQRASGCVACPSCRTRLITDPPSPPPCQHHPLLPHPRHTSGKCADIISITMTFYNICYRYITYVQCRF